MKIDGRCHCGNITFEAEVDPATAAICHCTDCQTLSGTAFRTIVKTKEGAFRLLSGTPKVYVTAAESGNKREHTFCPNCGAVDLGQDDAVALPNITACSPAPTRMVVSPRSSRPTCRRPNAPWRRSRDGYWEWL
jgi:hypothetical protein